MPIRIAFHDAFALFEGSGRAMLDIIDRLDPNRFEPVVVCPGRGAPLGAAGTRGYEIAVVESPGPLRLYNKALMSGGASALPGTALSILRCGLRLSRWLRRHRTDLLHCNQTRAALQSGLGGKMARIPVVWVSRICDELPSAAIDAVVTPVASAPVVGGVTGTVVPHGDAGALGGAIARLLSGPALAHRMGRAAREHVVRHYSLDATLGMYAELYEGLTDGRGTGGPGDAGSVFRARG